MPKARVSSAWAGRSCIAPRRSSRACRGSRREAGRAGSPASTPCCRGPRSSARPRERNGPGGRTQEIQRLIGRSLRAAMATMAFGEYHHPGRLRRAPGRRRDPHGEHHRRVRRPGGCLPLARGQDRSALAVRPARLRRFRRYRRRGAPPRPRLPRGPRRRRRCQHRDARAGPVRGGAGDRRARHLHPGRSSARSWISPSAACAELFTAQRRALGW